MRVEDAYLELRRLSSDTMYAQLECEFPYEVELEIKCDFQFTPFKRELRKKYVEYTEYCLVSGELVLKGEARQGDERPNNLHVLIVTKIRYV